MDHKNLSHTSHFEKAHQHWRNLVMQMSGNQDVRGIELVSTIRMLANLYEHAVEKDPSFAEVSGPRLGILIRLMGEESMGNHNGINPTLISRYQSVNKNTTSALLKGLEDQGLIERVIDPVDKRGFLIRITPAGRELVVSTTPGRLETTNRLSSGLSSEEKDNLLSLLGKLRNSIFTHGCEHKSHLAE